MAIPTKLLFSNLLKHNVRCENGIDHGPVVNPWMHPPVHRILGLISRPSNLRLERQVWRLDQVKGLNEQEIFVKGAYSISDDQTIERLPTLMNANVFNRSGQKLGLIADFFFEVKNGKIQYYLVSRTNPLIPGTSRWRFELSNIVDQEPGCVSANILNLDQIPLESSRNLKYYCSYSISLLNRIIMSTLEIFEPFGAQGRFFISKLSIFASVSSPVDSQ